ncbi:pectinesterase family protein [Paenibacillus puerhi]|uniref:pectinesterase family protein n=1 Tax=Paenibacillus puerhi TaxID=2692622 RepID=UPI001357CA44|nr:pectinesterase family protein [Paenibacillus puerhi]
MQERHIQVRQDGTGDFVRVQDAIDAVRVLPLEPAIITIGPGLYRERIVVPDNKPHITLRGESAENTILVYGDYAKKLGVKELGTFRTAVLKVEADDFRMEQLTVWNDAGFGDAIGQAVALYTAGDRQVYRGVRLLGNQDTLYTSRGRQFFENCYIEGHVDFIFGSATVLFENCHIHSLRSGYITAASTPAHQAAGYVFRNCRLTGEEEKQSVYLGRPWRGWAHTVFIDTWMGPHIHAAGWDNWSNPVNEQTSRYAEYGSTGPGAGERVSWARQLSESEVQALEGFAVLTGHDGWNPSPGTGND